MEQGDEGTGPQPELNLKQVAALLGVHYMTAYRYVRTGRLTARQVGTGWVVRPEDLTSFTAGRGEPAPEVEAAVSLPVDWRSRLRHTLVTGDETAAWRVLEQALAAGHSPTGCYLDLLVGAINEVSGRRTVPDGPVAEEYLATATAARLVARLGARFRRSGRTKGTVVFGAPLGEHHTLAISVVADLVRLEGFNCLELGADVPPEAFAGAAAGARRLVAVGIGVARSTDFETVDRTVRAVRAVDASIPVVVGGQATADDASREIAGVTAWASDGRQAVETFVALARERRTLWSVDGEHSDDGPGTVRTA